MANRDLDPQFTDDPTPSPAHELALQAPISEASELHFEFSVCVLEAELRLPMCHSLKAKRGILARVLNHLKKSGPVSVAEVAHQNSWSQAGIAVAALSSDRAVAEGILRASEKHLARSREVELVSASIYFL